AREDGHKCPLGQATDARKRAVLGIQSSISHPGPRYGGPATHSASLRAFTPVFDGLWTRVNALLLSRGGPRGDERKTIAHSGLMPTAFTRSDHIVSSPSMMAAYSSGVVGCGPAPSVARRSRTSLVMSAALSARLSVSMTGRGVPASAARPHR